MNEQQIRDIVRQEIESQRANSRFQLNPIQRHVHNGVDAPKVSQSDILVSSRASGNITMATAATTYTLSLSRGFAPTLMLFYGGAYHTTAGTIDIRSSVQGTAELTNGLYFQPLTSNSVQSGGLNGLIVQASTSFTVDSSVNPPVVRFVPAEGHIVNVGYPTAGTIVARATVKSFGPTGITIYTDTLASGWTIQGNWVVI